MIDTHKISAGYIASGVGSLSKCTLRRAGGDDFVSLDGPLEIVSMTGTVGAGGMHIHAAVADREGRVFGGHLVSGCVINTTAEIVITAVEGFTFNRRIDPGTGYLELDPN